MRGELLIVNLTNGSVSTRKIPSEYYAKFLDGKALGGRLAQEDKLYEIEPLSAENQLYFMVGPLTGTLIPGASKAVIVTRSPLTGIYLDSAVGGSLTYHIKMAGYDGIIIQGKSAEPVYLVIDNESVEIKPAGKLWGLGCFDTEKELRKNYGSAPGSFVTEK